jgi:glutamate-1-semialdehyde 2,1-aminomutase
MIPRSRESLPDAVLRLWAEVETRFERHFPRSAAFHREHGRALLDGGSHAVRWARPFMPVAVRAEGPCFVDLDGHRIVDFWQGHFANLFGHNPRFLLDVLRDTLGDGRGLQSGMIHAVEAEVAERLCVATGCETVRFTTAGTLGTFYATVLARAFTGRDKVVKISGGWHGSQPYGLKGVTPHANRMQRMESEGLSTSTPGEILLTRFNDIENLEQLFRHQGDQIACVLLEPILGAAGGLVATREFYRAVRERTEAHGALMLADEIITGFRFRAGDLSSLYGVRPDLVILGKAFGGGMPVAAVAGRRDVLRLASREVDRVKFEGGTYSSHELSLVAARATLDHLTAHEAEFYPATFRLGQVARDRVARAAHAAGVEVRVCGHDPAVLPGSSMVLVHPVRNDAGIPDGPPSCPETLLEARPAGVDPGLLKSMLLLRDVSSRNGLGMVSSAHAERDLARAGDALEGVFGELRAAGAL